MTDQQIPAIVISAEDEAFEELNRLELVEDDARWEQARIVAGLAETHTQREIAAGWRNRNGKPYSHVHVGYVTRAHETFGNLSYQDRPSWNDAYNSPKVRGKDDDGDGDEWYTPKWLFDALDLQFDLDACSPADRTHVTTPARRHYTETDNGLTSPWNGLVWCNPPYSAAAPWAEKMIDHADGLLLTHVPINGGWCLDVWRTANRVTLFQGMHFTRPDGHTQRPAWWLQLAAYGTEAAAALDALHHRLPPDLEPRWRPGPIWGTP